MKTKNIFTLFICTLILSLSATCVYAAEEASSGPATGKPTGSGDSLPATLGQAVTASPSQIVSKLYVPEMYGTVEEVFKGTDDKLVINIQDAHTDSKAQESISGMLGKLLYNYDVDSVWIEGASGVVDTSLMKSFPAPKVKKSLSINYRDRGIISGAEYFSINSKEMVHLFGAESARIYDENVKEFKKVWANHTAVRNVLGEMNAKVSVLKNKAYSKALKELDAKKNVFKEGDISFTAYCDYLKNQCKQNGIDLKKYSEFGRLLSLMQLEKEVDFTKVGTERISLIEDLSENLNRQKLTELTQLSLLFRLGNISPVDFYNRIHVLAKMSNIDLNNYPSLKKYIKYLDVSKSISRTKVNTQREKIESALFDRLSSTPLVRAVNELDTDFTVMSKFLNLKLSRKDYDYYLKHKANCSPQNIKQKINDLLVKNGLSTTAVTFNQDISPSVDHAGRFYALAVKRDGELVRHLLAGMSETGKERAVLVAGGFHTEGIKRLLKSKGISYAVILPKVGKSFDEERYVSLLLRTETPFLNYYKKKNPPDALPGSIGMISLGSRTDAVLAPSSPFEDNKKGINFKYGNLTDLPSGAVATDEMSSEEIVPEWTKKLKELIKKASPIEKGVFSGNVSKIDGIGEVYMPLRLNDDEIFVPVVIDRVSVIIKFYKEGKAPVIPQDLMIGAPNDVLGYMAQAITPAGFAQVILTSNVLVAPEGTYAVSPSYAAKYMASMSSEIKDGLTSTIASNVLKADNIFCNLPFPEGKETGKIKVMVIDIDEFETMVGLTLHLKELKEVDKDQKVVLVTEDPDPKKLMDTHKLSKAVHYDEIVQVKKDAVDQAGVIIEKIKSAFPEIEKQENYRKQDVVFVSPNTKRYGKVENNKINETPIVIPDVKPADDEYVSSRQIFLCAKLILENDGDIQALVAAILKEPSDYPKLKKFFAEQGIPDEDVKNVIYKPRPVKVPADNNIDEEIRGYINVQKAA